MVKKAILLLASGISAALGQKVAKDCRISFIPLNLPLFLTLTPLLLSFQWSIDTIASFPSDFLWGLGTAPARVEDQLDDA